MDLRYRSLLRASRKEFPLDSIAAIELESSHSSRGSNTYRIALVMQTGERVALHSYYSSGWNEKQRKIDRLNAFIGLQERAGGAPSILPMPAAGGIFEPVSSGETNAVAWTVERAGNYAGSAVTRWTWSGWQYYGRFVFIVQKPAGSPGFAGGLLGKVSELLQRQVLSLYGFNPADLPNIDLAAPVPLKGTPLEQNFAAFACEPGDVPQILSPWVAALLNQWAQRHPMRSKQFPASGESGQLAVMFGERALHVLHFSTDEGLLEELKNLGLDLAREARPPK